ncbi:hypothetical protein [Chryseosolibacter indicus]|uniref:Uncharacterized protein n=1 Tax=Chryseosolibacter indicus TaxID=2782351 RepID=A0ABS5VST2_9BACT|nr:hypothetical protein [Chryseosolibacter indicus]MBT1703895.1 hypothetical protein [Chryseosolibacter indicus]
MEDRKDTKGKVTRGDASMSSEEQRAIDNRGASDGGSSGRYQGSSGRSREDEDLQSISKQADTSEKDLNALQEEEITGARSESDDLKSANYSDTDEDEDEGLGDGNLGRARGEL